MIKIKTNRPIGFRIADIGPGGKEYNVRTNEYWPTFDERSDGQHAGDQTMKYQVLFDNENVWTLDGQTQYFASFEEAAEELAEHFADMDNAGMDYEPADYRIETVN